MYIHTLYIYICFNNVYVYIYIYMYIEREIIPCKDETLRVCQVLDVV